MYMINKKEDKESHNHSDHGWLMLLAHIVPMALIFILPALGFNETWTLIVPIAIIIGLHIWMMKDHLKNNKK